MELSERITPGMIREETFIVEEQHTAYHIGSGDEKVLGTPWMISFMERVSNRLIAEHLREGQMSVGVQVDVRHLAATPMNASVRVRAEVLEVVKNRVKLSIDAWDNADKIGEGTHLRAIVDKERFMARVLAKSASEKHS
ncbi:MAG TPA: thioesterase [Chloroflexi bacterium]|nr:thioesterase [Chloroflexota bacterium]HBY06412.1 thioesterase [Chloroflexota bacterium]